MTVAERSRSQRNKYPLSIFQYPLPKQKWFNYLHFLKYKEKLSNFVGL